MVIWGLIKNVFLTSALYINPTFLASSLPLVSDGSAYDQSQSSSSPAKSSQLSKLMAEHGATSSSSHSRMGYGRAIFTIVKYSTE